MYKDSFYKIVYYFNNFLVKFSAGDVRFATATLRDIGFKQLFKGKGTYYKVGDHPFLFRMVSCRS